MMSSQNPSQSRMIALLDKLKAQLTEQHLLYYETPKGEQTQFMLREIARLEAAVHLLEYQIAGDDEKMTLANGVIQAQSHYIRELEQIITQYENQGSATHSAANLPFSVSSATSSEEKIKTPVEHIVDFGSRYVRSDRQPPSGQTIEELNLDAKVYKALYQHQPDMTTTELITLLIDEPEKLLKIRRIGEYSTQHIAQRLRFKGYIEAVDREG